MQEIINILGAVFSFIATVLFEYWGWTLIAAWLIYLIWQNKRKTVYVQGVEHTLLHIIVPKNNDKKELSAEQLFASLHNILRPSGEITKEGAVQEHMSFEIVSENNVISFYVWTPKHLKDYVESQIYAQYPQVQIKVEDDDYAKQELAPGALVRSSEINLTKDEIMPIRTFATFEVDPLAGITTVLSKLEENEQLWVQILTRPVNDSWHTRSLDYVESVKSGKPMNLISHYRSRAASLPLDLVVNFFRALFNPPQWSEGGDKKPELSPGQTTINTAVEDKAKKLGYQVKIRVAYVGGDEQLAKQRLQALVGGFKQFNSINLNGFANTPISGDINDFNAYRARLFADRGYILNAEELASVYHLPHTSVETPNIAWTTTKVGEPPANLPTLSAVPGEALSLFGSTNFRAGDVKFGIKRADRMRHLYIIGKSGVGKSMLLQLLTLSDIYHDQGFAVVDPHGDYAQDIIKYIPQNRLDDVVYFNPADTEFPIAFNPMENEDENRRANIASEIVGVLKKMFGDSWGPRLEHILRFTLLALLESPDANMLGITRMLTDKAYRKRVVDQVKDPVVRAFWVNEFASWNDKFATEAVAPVLNKVGAFVANPLIRNVLGQDKSSFDIRKMMDEGKILIVDLSRGRLGEDNASILGALLITKIQLAAMSRADMPLDQRRPFYLYVDEFQNFATESFAVILSEARKYGLYLTVANQYVAQMPDEVKDAVFGNVGSIITYRVGADDAQYLAKYFEPIFEPADLVNLNIRNIYVTMSIDGETSLPFSAHTLTMPQPQLDLTSEIIRQSREKYSVSRSEVESRIAEWSGFRDKTEQKDGSQTDQNQKNNPGQMPNIPTVAERPRPQLPNISPKNYSQQIKPKHHQPTGHRK